MTAQVSEILIFQGDALSMCSEPTGVRGCSRKANNNPSAGFCDPIATTLGSLIVIAEEKMKRAILVLLVLVTASLSGCATMADARYARGEGISRMFTAPFDTVWKAVPEALSSLGLPVAADNKQEGYILAERGITAFSWGEKVAVFVDRIDGNKTKVEVVSKRAMATNIFAPDWGPEVLQRVEQVLASGK